MNATKSSPSRFLSPVTTLGITLAASIVLACLPSSKTDPLRNAWRESLRPGQEVLINSGDWVKAVAAKLRGTPNGEAPESPQRLAELTEIVRRLQFELLIERSRTTADSPATFANNATSPNTEVALASYQAPAAASPLLISQSIGARVLGSQAKSYLVARDLIDVGKSSFAQRDSLVVDAELSFDAAALIDQGQNAGINPNRLVLAGRRIWGRIADVGSHTSTVRRVNDAGYRDLVQLASQRDGRLHFSARGMLVGSGERLCKIELVEATQPVIVGDLVFTADDGVLDSPMLYGRIVKLEHKSGAAHWEIWMEPAVAAAAPPSRVAVLRMELNPARVAP